MRFLAEDVDGKCLAVGNLLMQPNDMKRSCRRFLSRSGGNPSPSLPAFPPNLCRGLGVAVQAILNAAPSRESVEDEQIPEGRVARDAIVPESRFLKLQWWLP